MPEAFCGDQKLERGLINVLQMNVCICCTKRYQTVYELKKVHLKPRN